jgi:hypothetical protein
MEVNRIFSLGVWISTSINKPFMSSASGHMKPPIQLLDLPTEILFKILCLLPASSLLTTTRVSKLFYETYHSSSFLQYIVALHTTHQKDFDDCTLPPSEKLQLLRERDARWKSAKWKRRQSVLCDEGNRGTLYDLLGGVLAIVSMHHDIAFSNIDIADQLASFFCHSGGRQAMPDASLLQDA